MQQVPGIRHQMAAVPGCQTSLGANDLLNGAVAPMPGCAMRVRRERTGKAQTSYEVLLSR